jgi:hypothetical protein
MISSVMFYFVAGLLTVYAACIGYAMIQMVLCVRWMVNQERNK